MSFACRPATAEGNGAAPKKPKTEASSSQVCTVLTSHQLTYECLYLQKSPLLVLLQFDLEQRVTHFCCICMAVL